MTDNKLIIQQNENVKTLHLTKVMPNTKTRLCKNRNTCVFGDACHYAHSIDQIVVVPCAYSNDCVFVSNENGNCVNINAGKICFFKHPCETTEQYHIRVGNTPGEPNIILINPIKIDLNSHEWVTVGRKKNNIPDDHMTNSAELFVKYSDGNIISKVEELLKNKTGKITLVVDYS